MEQTEQVIDAAVFGRQIEDFVKSDIGKYLIGRAREDADKAMEELAEVAPWRFLKIQELQNRVKLCKKIESWLSDAVIDGRNAMKLIEDSDG